MTHDDQQNDFIVSAINIYNNMIFSLKYTFVQLTLKIVFLFALGPA